MFHEIWICLHWPFCPGVFIAILAFVAGAVAFRVEKASTVEKAIWTFIFLMLVVGEIWMMGIDRAKHDQEQADARSEQLRKFQEIADGIKDSNEKKPATLRHDLGIREDKPVADVRRFKGNGQRRNRGRWLLLCDSRST